MTARTPAVRPIDLVVNSAGPWSTVRVEQPYGAMQQQGWDVRFVKATLVILCVRFETARW